MNNEILVLEISIILNETGAYKKITELLKKYNLDIDETINEYSFEYNLVKPIIEQYNDNIEPII